jgi:CheY-like chemotaxis protein
VPVLSALVVDDSLTVRNHLRAAIASIMRDCHVFEAEGALEAARFLSKFVPEVLFLDLNMPHVGGMVFLDKLDRILMGRKPPIIVSISGDVSPETLAALEARGAYDILPKPFEQTKLGMVLLRVVQMSRTRRVLIVDDSTTVRTLVKRIVQKSRFNLTVAEAADGEEAIRLFRGVGYDIAFIDVHMPGIDGLDAAGEVLYARNDVHVVLMSSDRDEGLRRAAAHIGVDHFLHKPFYPEAVDGILHALYGLTDSRFVMATEPESFLDVSFEGVAFVPRSTLVDMATPL